MRFKKIFAIILLLFFLINDYTLATDEQVLLDDYSFTNENSEVEKLNEVQNELEESQEENQEDNKGIYSESAILIEAKTGKVLFEKNMHDRKYPASTTKILTAIIAIEKCDLSEKAIASEGAISALKDGYTKADIQVGEAFTIEELLNVLILQSANEAANIIAEHISGSTLEFAKLMNEKAKEIGCSDSNFVNPNGMHDENHYSSAYDLAMIARYAMKNKTFRELVVKKECNLPHTEFWGDEQVEEHGERNFKNTNQLLNPESKYYYPYANGIKAGFTTPAKNCLVSSSNKDGFEVITVVLHAETTENNLSARYVDTINLFEYAYNNYNIDDILKDYDENDFIESNAEAIDTKDYTIIEETSPNQVLLNDDVKTLSIELIEMIAGALILIIVIIIAVFRKIINKRDN